MAVRAHLSPGKSPEVPHLGLSSVRLLGVTFGECGADQAAAGDGVQHEQRRSHLRIQKDSAASGGSSPGAAGINNKKNKTKQNGLAQVRLCASFLDETLHIHAQHIPPRPGGK